MTAIALVLHWDGSPVEPALLEAVNTCVSYRCPDGAWIWVDGPVGMAQADLATLPEDQPGIPVTSGHLRIAASCRIDNRDEIRRALPDEFIPTGPTDAAYILAAYQAWGDACVDHLIGDFAFVIWDAGHKRLFAARDIMGSRLLYYYSDSIKFFLASERTQILQDPTVPLEVDEEQLLEYFTPEYQWSDGWDQGLLQGIQALPAGSMLQAEAGQVTVRSFWAWQEHTPIHRPEQQVLQEYLHTLEEAVRDRLRSRSPVALELSGGLDSTAIVALAARISNGSGPDLHTLSLVFDELPEVDERHRIKAVLERYPLSSHFMAADRLYGAECFTPDWSPHAILGPGEIQMPQASIRLLDLAEQNGCRVVLTGWFGDALNDGSEQVYFDLLQRRYWREFRRRFLFDWNRSWQTALRRLLWHGLMPMTPWPIRQAGLIARERRQGMFSELPDYFPLGRQQRIREIDETIRLERVSQMRARCPVVRDTLSKLIPPNISTTMPFPQPLEQRHPYADRRLIEMVLSMPQSLKYDPENRTIDRLHHRRALAGILPNKIRLENSVVAFDTVIERCFVPAVMRDWFLESPVIHIFERGYVAPDRFLAAFTNVTDLTYLEAMLACEAWLRSLESGGVMQRLIPPRRVSA